MAETHTGGTLGGLGVTTTYTISLNRDTFTLTGVSGYDFLNRFQSVTSAPSDTGQPMITFQYRYNAAHQGTQVSLTDDSYWSYETDALGQVTAGRRYWQDGTRSQPGNKAFASVRVSGGGGSLDRR